jgi:hypothetical protein
VTAVSPRDLRILGRMRDVTPAASRRRRQPWPLRLWLPVSLLFILLAPFAIAAIPVLWLIAPLGRRDWAGAVFTVGAALLALHGTRIDVRTTDLNLSIELF